MEYVTDALGIKFIHWEYVKSNAPISGVEPSMNIMPIFKPGTKVKNGLLFRFMVKLYQSDQLTVDCIAEEVFINDGIGSFTFDETKRLIQFAFNRFNYKFERKIKSEGHPGASVDYTVKEADVFQVLERLNK